MSAWIRRALAWPALFAGGVAFGSSAPNVPWSPVSPAAPAAATSGPPAVAPKAPVADTATAAGPERRSESRSLRELRVSHEDRDEAGLESESLDEQDDDGSARDWFDPRPERARRDPGRTNGKRPSALWANLELPALSSARNSSVEKYLRHYGQSRDGRGILRAWLQRSGKYRKIFLATLRERSLPEELAAVAFVESGCAPTARSHAGAMGLWQLMPRTARAYGLLVEPRYDERRGIWRSTEAAANHLSDLYEYYKSWELALAAYNMGHGALDARIEEHGSEDFWVLSEMQGVLPDETAAYVPKVLAVAAILKNLRKFGFDRVKYDKALEAVELKVPAGVRLSLLARAAGTSVRELRALNPELLADATPRGRSVVVHVPARGAARARTMLPHLLRDTEDGADKRVAADYDWGRDDDAGPGQTERSERDRSAGPRVTRVRPGDLAPEPVAAAGEAPQEPVVGPRPAGPTEPTAPPAKPQGAPQAAPAARETVLVYRVAEGDSIESIARTLRLSTEELKASTGIRSASDLKKGSVLRVRVSEARASALDKG